MRKTNSNLALVGALAVLSFAPSASQASTIFIPRDTVVPVIVETNMTINRVRVGDRFTAHVDNDRDLPSHTRLIGRVRRIQQDKDDRRGFVDLEFTDVLLPDGSRHGISAIPVSLDDKYTERRADGRIVVKEDARKKETLVLGGMVGGFVLGSIIHKQAETTLLGTLAGIFAAESDRKNDGYTVLQKGQRIGMLVDQDTRLESYDDHRSDRRNDRYDDPRGNSRIDDRDRDRDGRSGSQGDDRYDPRSDDRNARGGNGDDRRIDPPTFPSRNDDRTTVITFEGRTLNFSGDAKPYREGDTVMVPLPQIVKELGLKMEKGATTGIYVDGEDSSLRLEQGSDQARLNGRNVVLSKPVTDRDGVTYVSLEIFASIKHGNLSVNGNRIDPQTY